jgi:hypothetical protein
MDGMADGVISVRTDEEQVQSHWHVGGPLRHGHQYHHHDTLTPSPVVGPTSSIVTRVVSRLVFGLWANSLACAKA